MIPNNVNVHSKCVVVYKLHWNDHIKLIEFLFIAHFMFEMLHQTHVSCNTICDIKLCLVSCHISPSYQLK